MALHDLKPVLGLQAIFQSERGLGRPIPYFIYIGGCYVQFSMADLPLFDVMSKIVCHGSGVTLQLLFYEAFAKCKLQQCVLNLVQLY